MAEEKPKRRRLKRADTVRERAAKKQAKPDKPRRLTKTANTLGRPFKKLREAGKREYYLPLPDNKVGRFLNKRRRVTPQFLREAWAELRQVTWPNYKETARMTFAVIMFAVVFAVLVGAIDFALDKLFREVIIQ